MPERINYIPAEDEREKFECDICGKAVSDVKTLDTHKQTHLGRFMWYNCMRNLCLDDNDPEQAKKKRPFECAECGTSFRNRANLRQHIMIRHTSEPL